MVCVLPYVHWSGEISRLILPQELMSASLSK